MTCQTLGKQRIVCSIAGLIALVISHAACYLIKLYLRHILRLSNVLWLIIEKVLALYDALHLVHISCRAAMLIRLQSVFQVSVPASSLLP